MSENREYNIDLPPGADNFENDTSRRDKKRKRYSTGNTVDGSPTHPIYKQPVLPTRQNFTKMTHDQKLDSMFDMLFNVVNSTQNMHQLNSFCYLQHAVNEVTEACLRLLEYKSIQMETDSLSKNLIFNGIAENEEHDHSIIARFLEDRFNMRGVGIVDAYRLGRRNVARRAGSQWHQPILIKFFDQRDVDFIMANVRNLKGTSYGISRDFPREIREARKYLWPEFKEARNHHGFRNVQFLFPAAIKINGEITKDLFPGWHTILQGSRNSDARARIEERHRHNLDIAAAARRSDIETEPVMPHTTPDQAESHDRPSNSDNEADTEEIMESANSESVSSHVPSEPGYLLKVHPQLQSTISEEHHIPPDKSTGPDKSKTSDADEHK